MDQKECEFCDRNKAQIFKTDIIHKKSGEVIGKRNICEDCLTNRKSRVRDVIIDRAHQKYQVIEALISQSEFVDYLKGYSVNKLLENLTKLCLDDFLIKKNTDT